MSGLRSAVGLMTVFPAGGAYDARAAVAWFTPVGVMLGVVLSLAAAGAWELWPPATAAAVLVALSAGLTGALHLDGLADTADAVLAPVSRERRLAILQDVHHGTFALVAVAAVLLLKYGALAGHGRTGASALLLSAPAVARAALLPSMRLFPPARPGGMGDTARAGATSGALACAGALAGVAAFAGLGWQGLVVGAGLFAFALALGAWFTSRTGGLTGDTYGALVELAEAAFLLAGSALLAGGWGEPFPVGGWP